MNAKAYFAQARSLPVQIQAKTKQLQAVRTLQERSLPCRKPARPSQT